MALYYVDDVVFAAMTTHCVVSCSHVGRPIGSSEVIVMFRQ